MKFRALYTDHPWPHIDIERAILADANCEVIGPPDCPPDWPADKVEERLVEMASGVDAILTCWAPVTARVIDAAAGCRHISRTGIGLDNIDVAHATRRGITVTNVPDYCVQEVAEHALAMVLSLARKISVCHLATKQGVYDLPAAQPIDRVAGKTLGVVGLGQTGALLAGKARALGLRVLGNNRSGVAPEGVEWAPLDRLLAESDYVSINAPLTDATRHLVNHQTLALMKPTAYLINTARGGLVDHDALAAALAAGQIAGAALDVQDREPPDLSRAPYNDPRVIVTPHTAFCSPEAIRELCERCAQQAADALHGRTPENVVNPEVLGDRP